jgi:dTDP-4-dehydrorhamnose 3,5-epimerase
MLFTEQILSGVYIIEPEFIHDERGYFTRTYCQKEFQKLGIQDTYVQENTSYNKKRGTVRGMHYQSSPYEEAKIVSCTQGAIMDVIVDIRDFSSTFGRVLNVELTEECGKMLYIPEGFAHGFQTLTDNTKVCYQMSEYYHPESSRGISPLDPELSIDWPLETAEISDKDKNLPWLADAGLLNGAR